MADNYLSLAIKIKSGKFDRIRKDYSDELQRIIQWCLSIKESQRPSVDDLMNLPNAREKAQGKQPETQKERGRTQIEGTTTRFARKIAHGKKNLNRRKNTKIANSIRKRINPKKRFP